MSANADTGELEKFAALADQWWDPQGPLRTLHELNPLRLDYIAQRAQLRASRILDVGCGGGLLSEALAQAGAEVVGIDLAEASLNAAREHASSAGLGIEYRQASIEDVASAEPEAFDAVTCMEVLEHVPDPGSVIAACARAVKPGGTVFISTINRNPKSFLYAIVGAEYLLGLLPRGTHRYLSLLKPAEIAATARESGLSVESLTGLHYNPLTRQYWLGGNVDVNYFVHTTKPVSARIRPQ
jgi:2-polyprenyl-6-hydroxyphenyl methylase/3-demethylubiquinone-9 3-methyltransferase